MKFISTRTHGLLDYLVSLLLIVMPWIFGFAQGGAETWVPVVLGLSTIIYSLLTHYEYGVVRLISVRQHLTLDMVSGALLMLSPLLFGFDNFVVLPHVIFGIVEIIVPLCTDPFPYESHVESNKE